MSNGRYVLRVPLDLPTYRKLVLVAERLQTTAPEAVQTLIGKCLSGAPAVVEPEKTPGVGGRQVGQRPATHKGRPTLWAQRDEVLRMHADGVPSTRIAAKLGYHPVSVRRFIAKERGNLKVAS